MNKKEKIAKPELKDLLEQVLADFPPAARTNEDPVQFPRRYFEQGRSVIEIEAVALFAAMLAYGSAAQFIKKIKQTLDQCNWNFLALITGKDAATFPWPGYRLSTAKEIGIFAQAIGNLISKHQSIKKVFIKGYQPESDIRSGLSQLQQALCLEVKLLVNEIPRGVRHLLPDPAAGGCAKRWHMFLRWLVRPDDGVDMNLWNEIPSAKLLIPLDRHISRISRNLNLTSRATDDWKTAEEISARLREMSPDDPIRYDFSLCHLGIAGKCTHGKDQKLCGMCLLSKACKAFKPIK